MQTVISNRKGRGGVRSGPTGTPARAGGEGP